MSPRGRRTTTAKPAVKSASRSGKTSVGKGRRGRTAIIPTVQAVAERVGTRLAKAANIRAVVRALNSEAKKLSKVAAAEKELVRTATSVLRRLERQEKKVQAELDRIRKDKAALKK